jgi:hypothetical protein
MRRLNDCHGRKFIDCQTAAQATLTVSLLTDPLSHLNLNQTFFRSSPLNMHSTSSAPRSLMAGLPPADISLRQQEDNLRAFVDAPENARDFAKMKYNPNTEPPPSSMVHSGIGTKLSPSALVPGTMGVFIKQRLTRDELQSRSDAATQCAL